MHNSEFGVYLAALFFILSMAFLVSRVGDWLDGLEKPRAVAIMQRCTELGCDEKETDRPR